MPVAAAIRVAVVTTAADEGVGVAVAAVTARAADSDRYDRE